MFPQNITQHSKSMVLTMVLIGREEVRAEMGHGPASVCLTGMNRYSTDGECVCVWAFSGAEEQGRLHLAETT